MSNKELGNKLFSFAVISDTHVNADEDYCDSPFPVNARANKRFRNVIADINQREVEFVMHLGDLLHPVPKNIDLYRNAATAYREIASNLNVPMHIIPGNHDIGDTPIAGAPTSPITDEFIDVWKHEFGAQYTSYAHGGLNIMMINAQLINSGLEDEKRQRVWLETELSNINGRTLLMLHHPIYVCDPDESEHYDNTNAPGRAWLLDLLAKHEVEAVFCGHAHNFWYNRFEKTDIYLSPATSFVRQDYSEMLRAAPPQDSEFGRDDKAKLGYLMVDIHQHGHPVQFVRTNGEELIAGGEPKTSIPLALTPRANRHPKIGFDLRKNWAEITEILPSGGLDEFDRKRVRNDYQLLALIEMGVKDVRIPLSDLRDTERCQRIRDLSHLGLRFTLFGIGIPQSSDLALIKQMKHYLYAWEITIAWNDFDSELSNISDIHDVLDVPIYICRLRTQADIQESGKYFHVINHGFSATGDEVLLEKLARAKKAGIVGAVFRLSQENDTVQALGSIDQTCSKFDLQASIHLRVAGDDPSENGPEHKSICRRVDAALNFVNSTNTIRIFCDTLVEVDRGYFPRSGAIDRCCNPAPLSNVVKTAHTRK